MDVFPNPTTKIVARGLAKIQAEVLCSLGLYVELNFEDFTNINAEFSVEEYKKEAQRLSTFVRLEELLSDKYFRLSLRLGLLRHFMKREDLEASFLKHLYDIFSPNTADELWTYAFRILREDGKEKRDLFPSQAEVQELQRYRYSIVNFGKSYQEIRPPKVQGTATYLLKCKKCGAQKRCDAKTKDFACKTCGNADVRITPNS